MTVKEIREVLDLSANFWRTSKPAERRIMRAEAEAIVANEAECIDRAEDDRWDVDAEFDRSAALAMGAYSEVLQ